MKIYTPYQFRTIRILANITLKEVSEHAYLSQPAIYNYEKYGKLGKHSKILITGVLDELVESRDIPENVMKAINIIKEDENVTSKNKGISQGN